MAFPRFQVYNLRMKSTMHWWARNLIRTGKSLSSPYFWWVTLSESHITKGDLKEILLSISQFFSFQSTRVSASAKPGIDDSDDDNFGSDNGDKYLMNYVTWSNPGKTLAIWMGLLYYLNWTIPIHRLLTPTHSLCNLVNLTQWIYGEAY